MQHEPYRERYSEQELDAMAEKLLATMEPQADRATILGLSGELGAGKTTLTQAIARQLGVDSEVLSPTFVVMKSYDIPFEPNDAFKKLVHMDAYRIESPDELAPLRFGELIQEPNTLIIVEWPERISDALPEHTRFATLEHDGDHRIISSL